MTEIVTSIRIDDDLWKQAKIHAIKNDETLGHLVERLIRKELEMKE